MSPTRGSELSIEGAIPQTNLSLVSTPHRFVCIFFRQQFYGEVYYHTTGQNALVQPLDSKAENTLDISVFDWIREKLESEQWRRHCFGDLPYPTQVLVNEYNGLDGISSHFEDEQSFGDIIVTISLLSPTLMSMQRPEQHNNDCMELLERTKVLLEPRSLLVMAGAARFEWRHGISKTAVQVPMPDGGMCRRDDPVYRRISLTIRHLREGRRRTDRHDGGIATAAGV